MSASFPVKNINPDNKRFSIYILIGEQGQDYASENRRSGNFGRGGLGDRDYSSDNYFPDGGGMSAIAVIPGSSCTPDMKYKTFVWIKDMLLIAGGGGGGSTAACNYQPGKMIGGNGGWPKGQDAICPPADDCKKKNHGEEDCNLKLFAAIGGSNAYGGVRGKCGTVYAYNGGKYYTGAGDGKRKGGGGGGGYFGGGGFFIIFKFSV